MCSYSTVFVGGDNISFGPERHRFRCWEYRIVIIVPVLRAHRIVFWWTSRSTKTAGFVSERIHTPPIDSAVDLYIPLDIHIVAAVKDCIKREDIPPHNFSSVCLLITVFADSFIIAYLCEFRRRRRRQIVSLYR